MEKVHFLGPRNFFWRKISFFPFLSLENKTRISPFLFPHFQPNTNYPREEGSGICEKEIMFFSFPLGVIVPYHCTLSHSLFSDFASRLPLSPPHKAKRIERKRENENFAGRKERDYSPMEKNPPPKEFKSFFLIFKEF